MRLALAGLVAAALGGLAACGPPPPQAPQAQVTILGKATSTVSTICGLASEITAFPGDHRRSLSGLERRADGAGRAFAGVLHRDPAWLYQGATVRRLVSLSVAALRGCSLGASAARLAAAAGGS